uniref:Uncharacterized protein n=1 Tax=Rhizophora mucronata TaxID=61149 RepID=A0A2P2NKU0_RHIMU
MNYFSLHLLVFCSNWVWVKCFLICLHIDAIWVTGYCRFR